MDFFRREVERVKRLVNWKRGLSALLVGVMLISQGDAVSAAYMEQNTAASTEHSDNTKEIEIDEITTAEGTGVVRPAEPDTLRAEKVTWQTVTLKWSQVDNAAGYMIYRRAAGESDYTKLVQLDGAQGTIYTDNANLVAGVAYTYQVSSYQTYLDANGATQYVESEKRATITATPSLGTTNLYAECTGSRNAVLTWEAVEGATGYFILRAQGNGSFERIADVSGAVTYTDNGLSTGSSYRYKVQPYRADGTLKLYGDESAEAVVTPVPEAPTLTAEVAGTGSVRLSWKTVGGAAGYTIERKVAGSGDFALLTTISSGTLDSYVDAGVHTGGEYVYRIRAYCLVNGGVVEGKNSREVSILATLGAPQLTFEDLSLNSITVRWTQVPGAQGYEISRALSPDGEFRLLAVVTKEGIFTYKDSGLALGTTYYYKVRSYATIDGKKVYGAYSAAAQQQCVPAAPKLTAEASGTTSVKLVWEKVEMPAGESGYYIYQVTETGEKKIKTCKNTAVSYTVKKLVYGASYTYRVCAWFKDANGTVIRGALSDALTTTPALAAVTVKRVAPSKNGGLEISWKYTKGQEEDEYLIYRSTKKKSGFKKIKTVKRKAGAKSGSYTDKKISVGKKYYYKVICRKKMGDGSTVKSAYSEVVGAKATPAAPTLKVQPDGVSSVKLTWNKIKGSTSSGYVNGYHIYRSTSEKGKYKKAASIGSGMTSSYVDDKLTTGVVYYYKIRAYRKINNKYVYGSFSKTVSIKVVPGQTTLKSEGVDYGSASMSWSPVAGVTGYRVYRAESADGKYAKVASIAASKTTYTDTKLVTGKTYYYKVRAYAKRKGKNVYGKYSNVISAVPTLGKPTGLQAIMIDQSQIKLIWNAVPGAETYTILRATSPNGKYKIASEICTTNSFTDTNVAPGNIYYYKVFAVRGEFKSETTDYVTAVSGALELSASSVTVRLNGSVKVTATAKPEAVISWTSDDPSVATVTTDGTIYGMKIGTTTVRASANGVTKTVAVSVQEKVNAKGVVISKDSGNVNFASIKTAGYEYVMLRITSGQIGDTTFESNYTKAKAAGLKVGVYCYAAARSRQDAEKEAYKVLETLNGRQLDYPIVYQMEEQTLLYGLTNAQRNDIIDSFKTYVNRYGSQYRFALRTSLEWLTKYLDQTRLNGMDIWVTNYRAETAGHGYTGTGNVVMWCYTKDGIVNGVSGKASVSISYYGF